MPSLSERTCFQVFSFLPKENHHLFLNGNVSQFHMNRTRFNIIHEIIMHYLHAFHVVKAGEALKSVLKSVYGLDLLINLVKERKTGSFSNLPHPVHM